MCQMFGEQWCYDWHVQKNKTTCPWLGPSNNFWVCSLNCCQLTVLFFHRILLLHTSISDTVETEIALVEENKVRAEKCMNYRCCSIYYSHWNTFSTLSPFLWLQISFGWLIAQEWLWLCPPRIHSIVFRLWEEEVCLSLCDVYWRGCPLG